MTNIGTLHGPLTSTTNDTNKGRSGIGQSTVGVYGSGRPAATMYPEVTPNEKEMFQDELEGEEEEDLDNPDNLHNLVNDKAFMSGPRDPVDVGVFSPDDYKSRGAGKNVGHVARSIYNRQLAASYKRSEERLLKEFISTSIRALVTGTIGDPYHPSSSSTSNVNGMNPGDPSIDQGGYGQGEETPDMWPYSIPGDPSVDGGETTNKLDDNIVKEFPFKDKESSTYTYLKRTSTKEYNDMKNVEKQQRRFRYNQKK